MTDMANQGMRWGTALRPLTRRQMLAGLAAGGIAGLLAACRSSAPATPVTSSTGAGSNATPQGASAAPATVGRATVELTFFYPVGVAGPLSKLIQQLVDQFNQSHPQVHVTASFTGDYTSTTTKVLTALNAHQPPDVAILLSTDLQTLLDLNAIVPIDAFLTQAGPDFALDDFQPAFLKNSQAQGKTWSVPFQRSTPVLYANQAALQAAGRDPNALPQTWDELVEVAQRAMQTGKVSWGVEIPATGSAYWLFQALCIEAGHDLNGDGPASVAFDTAASRTALHWMVDLSRTMRVMPTGAIDWSATPTDFAAGHVAFVYHSTGSLRAILNQASFPVGVGFLPKREQYGTPTGGGNLYIFREIPTERQQAAWTFIQWMTAPERAAQWAIDTGYVPTRRSALETAIWRDYVAKTPQARVALDQLAYSYPELNGHQSGQLQKLVSDAVQAAVTGQKSPEQALADAQRQADQILAAYR